MSSAICYFSGSGNSKTVAGDLKLLLDYEKVLAIKEVEDEPALLEGVTTLGLVYPIYFSSPPAKIATFILQTLQNLTLDLEYLFVVHTHGGPPLWGYALSDLLLSEAGYASSFNGGLKMVDTYVPLFKIPSLEKQQKAHKQTGEKIILLANALKKQEFKVANRFPFSRLLLNNYKSSLKKRATKDQNFNITVACDGCAICEKVCPVGNIEMVEGRPHYLGKCEQCLGCYHHCPQRAIRFKKRPFRGYSWYTPPSTFLPKG